MLNRLIKKPLSNLFLIGAVIFIAFAVIGAFRAYSNVPYWDMWDGYLDFYVRATSGDWSAWWYQHNEHRIFLARIFFWIDLRFFHGQVWSLIALNYILVSLCCLIFWLALKEKVNNQADWLGYFLIAWLFSWSQSDNLTVGFQCQFILAQLLPLASFYCLHKSVDDPRVSLNYFLIATIFGVLAVVSMANGVIALPLLTLFGVLIQIGWRRCCALAALSIFCICIYFYGYVSPGGHGSLELALRENPLGVIQFIMAYVGGPFSYVGGSFSYLRNNSVGLLIAKAAGCILIISSVLLTCGALRNPRKSSLNLALLFFILYVGGSALGTAGGRLIFGIDQALSSRYMTPALMAWAALAVLLAPQFIRFNHKLIAMLFLLLLIALYPQQLKALQSIRDNLFERNVAALAIELGIKDQEQISTIFPSAEWALSIAKVPVEENLSIFGVQPFVDLRGKIGRQVSLNNLSNQECEGRFDGSARISDDARFIRVRGWLLNLNGVETDDLLTFTDETGRIVGYAYGGQGRADLSQQLGKGSEDVGFKGYVLASYGNQPLYAIANGMQCLFRNTPPITFFRLHTTYANKDQVNVRLGEVIESVSWSGLDYAKSNLPGLIVRSSLVNSDADMGTLTIKMKRGDTLLYRSGPTGGHQIIEILGSQVPPAVLPVTLEWKVLEFSGDHLPERFSIKFSDQGATWGEWSAIAVKKTNYINTNETR